MLFVRSGRRATNDWRDAVRLAGSREVEAPRSGRLLDCPCLDDLEELEPGLSDPG